jgi:hypothetical protein
MDSNEYDFHLEDISKYFKLYLEIELNIKIGSNIWIKSLGQKDGHTALLFYMFDKYGEYDPTDSV